MYARLSLSKLENIHFKKIGIRAFLETLPPEKTMRLLFKKGSNFKKKKKKIYFVL